MQRYIVVIGGSFGSTAVLKHILGSLPPDLLAAILVAAHCHPQRWPSAGNAEAGGALTLHQAVDRHVWSRAGSMLRHQTSTCCS
jgi:hypothetical protein